MSLLRVDEDVGDMVDCLRVARVEVALDWFLAILAGLLPPLRSLGSASTPRRAAASTTAATRGRRGPARPTATAARRRAVHLDNTHTHAPPCSSTSFNQSLVHRSRVHTMYVRTAENDITDSNICEKNINSGRHYRYTVRSLSLIHI